VDYSSRNQRWLLPRSLSSIVEEWEKEEQLPSIDHLPHDLQQQYIKMRKEQVEFSSKEEGLMKELAAIRTTKRKLGAKLRRIQKAETAKALMQAQNAAAAASVPPPKEVPTVGDLNSMEKDQLKVATERAPITSKALDDAKRDAKAHSTQMISIIDAKVILH
ncbi:hypothetical protein PRIPAC_89526, partial [Pristionchus pacificus]